MAPIIQGGIEVSMKSRRITAGLVAALMVVGLSSSALASNHTSVPGSVYGVQRPPELIVERVVEKLSSAGVTQVAAQKVADHWAGSSVVVLVELGITEVIKVENNEVKLDVPISSQNTVAVFAKVLGVASKADTPEVAAQKAEAAGLTAGPAKPEEPMTRMEVAKLLANALGVQPRRFVDETSYPFNDASGMSQEDMRLLAALYDLGIFKGFEDRTFRPNSVLTAAQIAILIDRILGVAQ